MACVTTKWPFTLVVCDVQKSWQFSTQLSFSENNNDEDDLGLGLILVGVSLFPRYLWEISRNGLQSAAAGKILFLHSGKCCTFSCHTPKFYAWSTISHCVISSWWSAAQLLFFLLQQQQLAGHSRGQQKTLLRPFLGRLVSCKMVQKSTKRAVLSKQHQQLCELVHRVERSKIHTNFVHHVIEGWWIFWQDFLPFISNFFIHD